MKEWLGGFPTGFHEGVGTVLFRVPFSGARAIWSAVAVLLDSYRCYKLQSGEQGGVTLT